MGSSSKRGGGSAYQPQATYGGSTMPQAQAQEKYKADLAAWRAPTTSATMTPEMQKNPVPTTPSAAFGSDGGPALPGVGVPLTAPVAVQRNNLAGLMSNGAMPLNSPYGGVHSRISNGGISYYTPQGGRFSPAIGGGYKQTFYDEGRGSR